MHINLYTSTIPVMRKSLVALSGIIDKAAAHASTKATDRAPVEKQMDALFNDRLVFDQFALGRQIQIATDNAKGGAARLAGIEAPQFDDTEKTVEEFKARLQRTIDFLDTVSESQIAGREDELIVLPYYPNKSLTGSEYAALYLIPNFFFHVTTAYAILRSQGVPLGKSDFIGQLPFKDLA